MAHFAKIENGIVVDVVVVGDQHEVDGNAYLNGLGLVGTWVQTSYSGKIRHKFASIGDAYDAKEDVFKPAKPFASWIWNANTWMWDAPFPAPAETGYRWDEETQTWMPLTK